MMDGITPAQQTTLLVIAALILLVVVLRQVGRYLRRAQGTIAIMRAQERAFNEPEVGYLPGPWKALRGEVEMANRVLDRRVYQRAENLFLDHYARGHITPAALTPEFSAEEFLLVVDEHGQHSKPDRAVVESYQKTVDKYPLLQSWFREAILDEGMWAGVRTLTAARWLCHLVGLRHAVAEIFIDPPDQPGYTYVRVVESVAVEQPAAVVQPAAQQEAVEDQPAAQTATVEVGSGYELPCAVHITDMEKPEAALEMELQEICGLGLVDLDDLRLLVRYNDYGADAEEAGTRLFVSNEHRLLYRARLKAQAPPPFGLTLISLEDLRALLREQPDRLGPRLRHAAAFYDDLPGQLRRVRR